MTEPGRLRVVLDASALADHRASAGIGRYVRSLAGELQGREDLDLVAVRPPVRPPRESWAIRFAWAQPWIAPHAVAHRAALVHAMASDPVLLWPLRRQVVTLHDVVPWTRPGGGATGRYLELQRRRLQRCGAVIAVSPATAAEAVAVLGLEETRVQVVPEGVSADFHPGNGDDDDARRRKAGVPEGPSLVWVGSMRAFDPRKATDDLLAAVAGCSQPGVALVLVGARGAESARLEAEAERLGVRVVLPGYVDDGTLAAIYRGATAAIVPSHDEGFGLPALEAMACGTPLIAARAGNLTALVGDAALLFDAGDRAALSAAVDRVLGDQELAATLLRRGPEVAEGYSWARTADLTVDVYRRVLEGL